MRRWGYHVVLVACAFAGAVCALVVRMSTVTSPSMAPTVRPGQHVILFSRPGLVSLGLKPMWPQLRRGDLLVLRGPDTRTVFLKRLAGLPGDRVSIREGLLFINDLPISEPYAHHKSASLREADDWPRGGFQRDITMPEDTIFVLGDNRSESEDSRLWGPMPIASVVGLVIATLP